MAELELSIRRGSHNSKWKTGLWLAAPYAIGFVDLVWPTVTRTLVSLFSCRDLGSAGWWLEADARCNQNTVAFASNVLLC